VSCPSGRGREEGEGGEQGASTKGGKYRRGERGIELPGVSPGPSAEGLLCTLGEGTAGRLPVREMGGREEREAKGGGEDEREEL
jgi:hypothetical protein